jgi:anti-sigma B factor antagonist
MFGRADEWVDSSGFQPGADVNHDIHRAQFDVRREDEGDVAILSVAGDADLHSAPVLRAALNEVIDSGARRVIIDLEQATFLDSMTLGILLGALRRLTADSGGLVLAAPSRDVRRVFEITSLDRVFELAPTRVDALASFDGTESTT